MAHNCKATLVNLPSVNDCPGSPLALIKAKPSILTQLLCPNTGYLQRVKEVYHHKKSINKKINDSYVMDGLTLILDIDETILSQFRWTDILRINQQIEYDNQNTTITEIHYIVQTKKTKPLSDTNTNDIIGKLCMSPVNSNNSNNSNNSRKNNNKQFDHYLAHITSSAQEIPIKGGWINGKEILDVSVYQIVIEFNYSFNVESPTFLSATRTITDTDRIYDTSKSSTNETPIPTAAIIIDIEDDIEKVNKINVDKILKQFKDDVIKVNDIYVALRPHLDEFLFLCQRIFDDIILFTSKEKENMNGVMKAVHSYLINKLSKNKKEYSNKKSKPKLWKDVKYRDYCDIASIAYGNYNGIEEEIVIKNICKFGVDLSRIIMIDNNQKYLKGFQPNCIKMKKYIINSNDNELMGKIWPILFECYKYNDIRYGLLGKQKMSNTNPISIESDSLAQAMQYLVILQYAYFKSAKIINNDSVTINNGNDNNLDSDIDINVFANAFETDNSSAYSTDEDDDYEHTDTESEMNDDKEEDEEESDIDEYGINKYNNTDKVEPAFNCSSVFTDIGGIFNNSLTFIGRCVSK